MQQHPKQPRLAAGCSTDVCCFQLSATAADGRNSESRRALLKETLGALLPSCLIAIVAGYEASRSVQFADELYAELWNGKTDLLGKLYDAERNMLTEPHAFWDYLAQGAQPVVGLVHMLMEAEGKHLALKGTLSSFAVLVCDKVPQAAYLIREYFGSRMYLDWTQTSLDLWPQALLDDEEYFKAGVCESFDLMTRVYYLLTKSNVQSLENQLYSVPLDKDEWLDVFRTLHALEPVLLRKFFDIGFSKYSSKAKTLFEMTPPGAMGMDPALDSVLTTIARRNGWAKPVAEESVQEGLADSEAAGGSVHMQPLMPVDQSVDSAYNKLRFCRQLDFKDCC